MHNIKSMFLIGLLATAATVSVQATESDRVVKVYAQHDYHRNFQTCRKIYKWWYSYWSEWDDDDEIASMFTLGSAWAIDDPNIGQVLVTAGHVLGINSTPKPICKQMVTANGIINMSHPGEDATDDYGSYATQDYTKKVTHVDRVSKVIIGSLASEVDKIGLIYRSDGIPEDIAFLRMRDNKIFDGLTSVTLSKTPPDSLQEVVALGCPSLPSQQLKKLQVASVGREIFQLNEALPAGYSGGVIIDANPTHAGYGVILNTIGDKQTRVFIITPEMIGRIKWKTPSEVLTADIYDAD